MANKQDTPLLELQTSIQRKTIKIDDQFYPLRNLSEFSLIERHEFALVGKLMMGMTRIGEEGDEANQAVNQAHLSLDSVMERLLIGAEEPLKKLSDEAKLQVLNCFFEQAGINPQKLEKVTASQLKQQRVSKDSTAARQKAG